MTEQDALPAKVADPQDRESPPPRKKGNALLWTVLIVNLLILIGLSAGVSWFWWNDYRPMQQRVETQHITHASLNDIQQQNLRLTSELKDISNKQQSVDNSLSGIIASVQGSKDAITSLEQTVAELDTARSSDWQITEADYLARMAGRKIWLEGDTKTAIKLLQEADKRIAETGDPALFALRTTLAADIQQLELVNPVSSVSVALTLSGLLASVDNLPLDTIKLPDSTELEPIEVSENISDWRQNLGRIWASIKDDFFTVRRREAPVQPLMTEAQAFLAKERVKHYLMQAQAAALAHEATLYQQSLQQVVAGLVEHFDMQHHQVEQFLEAIANLQETNIERKLPQSLRSQNALEQVLKRRDAELEDTELEEGSPLL